MPYWVVRFDGNEYITSEPFNSKAEANREAGITWHGWERYIGTRPKDARVFVMKAPIDRSISDDKEKYPNWEKSTNERNLFDSIEPYQNEDHGTYILRDREAGNLIEGFKTLAEAQAALEKAEQDDKDNDEYEEDFYEIAKRNTKGTYDTYVPPVKTPKTPKIGYKMPTQSMLNKGFRR